MLVEVQLFAILRERAGTERVSLELGESATASDAVAELARQRPELAGVLGSISFAMAVNRDYAEKQTVLHEGDEIALVPPVSGGAGGPRSLVEISSSPLSLDRISDFVRDPAAGAIVTFQGVTRDVPRLEYEAYEPMAHKRLEEICDVVLRQHDVLRVAVFHRTGDVSLSEASVITAASSGHRPEAFLAARELIDRVKSEAPIWKREVEADGSASWVEGVLPGPDLSIPDGQSD